MREDEIVRASTRALHARLNLLASLLGTEEEDLAEDEISLIHEELERRETPGILTAEEERLVRESDERAAFNDRLDNFRRER